MGVESPVSVKTGNVVPRARLAVSLRELSLALGVLGIGGFITVSWLRNPDGHTVRRLATGVAALLVGMAVVYLSFRRSCSACGYPLRTFSFRATGGAMPGIEQALANGDAVGAGRLLNEALTTSPNTGEASCSLSYCDGCRGLLSVDVADQAGARRPRIVTGARAMSVIPAIEHVVQLGQGDR